MIAPVRRMREFAVLPDRKRTSPLEPEVEY